jgi:hypothetical protein
VKSYYAANVTRQRKAVLSNKGGTTSDQSSFSMMERGLFFCFFSDRTDRIKLKGEIKK